MRILELGNLPSWAGGKCEDGLNNAIYQITRSLANLRNKDSEVFLAATDFFSEEKEQENINIIGWNKKILSSYLLSHPFKFIKIVWKSLYDYLSYNKIDKLTKIIFRNLFLNYAIDKTTPDILHLHGYRAIYYIPFVNKKTKVVLTFHGILSGNDTIKGTLIFEKIEQKLVKNSKIGTLVFVTRKLKDDFIKKFGIPKPPIDVITNSYDKKNFYYIPKNKDKGEGKLVLVTVGSISDLKGQMRVLQGIRQSGVDIRYICVGNDEGRNSGALLKFAKDNNLDFHYTGKKKPTEIREILSEADFMILPSTSEGFGLVFLESLACGVPVILPKGLPIVAEKGIINPKNSILLEDCTVESISKILPGLDASQYSGKEISEGLREFSWENVAKEYFDLFLKLSSHHNSDEVLLRGND